MKNIRFAILAVILINLSQVANAQLLPSYIPSDGLIGWWPFNGSPADESGSGNHGVANGAILTADRFGNPGKAYVFDGVNDFIDLGDMSDQIDNLGGFTISYWMKSSFNFNDFAGTRAGGVFSHWIFDGQPTSPIGFINTINNQGKVGLSAVGGSGGFSAFQLQQEVFSHITVTFKGSDPEAQRFRLWVNGQLVENINIGQSITTLGSAGNKTVIGAVIGPNNPNFVYCNFLGSLDDIAIWNRALSQQEISSLYQGSNSGGGGSSGVSNAFPQGISYQAIARNAQGQILTNTNLQLRFTIISDSLNGNPEYSELHSLTSNAQGLISTSVGSGAVQAGNWDVISWAAGRKFLRAELNAGNGFVNMGTQEMLSVPFARRSKSADTIENNRLPVYSSNAEAIAGGMKAGQLYRTSSGILMVVY